MATADPSLAYTVLDGRLCHENFHFRVSDREGDGNASKLTMEQRLSRGFVIGHVGYGFGDAFASRRFSVILLREPVSRALSYANYFRSSRKVRFGDMLREYHEARLNQPDLFKAKSVSVHRLVHL